MEEKPTLEKVLHAIDVFYKNADPQANKDEMAEAHTWLMKLQPSVSAREKLGLEKRVFCATMISILPRRSTRGRLWTNSCD